MNDKLPLLLMLVLVFACTKPETTSVAENADTSVVAAATSDAVPEWSLVQYEKELKGLSNEPEAVMQALDYFKFNMNATDSASNDRALSIFMDFQIRLLEALNNKLMESSDYEDVNSLAYADSTQYTARAFEFQKRISENGLALGFAEGTVYIESNPIVVKEYFFPYVTSGTKTYLTLYEKEILQPSSADAGIILSSTDFADRVAGWDLFINQYPENPFVENARNNLKFYRYFFLVGMDNTPAFEYESNKINEELLQAFHYFLEKYPTATTASVVRNYLELLKKSDFIKNEEIEEFAGNYSAYN